MANCKHRIGFLSNKLTLRGTEIAMYDYADFNETLLHNTSIIITRDYNRIRNDFDVSLQAYHKFANRFPIEFYHTQEDIERIVEKHHLTHLYVIKSGSFDGIISTKCKNLVHCVFTTAQPHGQVYSAISDEVNRLCNTNYPVVPHMIRNYDTDENARADLSIPENAIVFGRYGGVETFDIGFVHSVIRRILTTRDDIYFLFMNTNVFFIHPRIIYIRGTTDMKAKRRFINSCDALLHARTGGETFGLTCGEFALALKPVITYAGSRERNHITILGDKAVLYSDESSLYDILMSFHTNRYPMENNGYFAFGPDAVMKTFQQVYL